MLSFLAPDDFTRCSTFSVAGGCAETFISITTPEGATFAEALADLTEKYAKALTQLGRSDASAIFCRIFLSDILNQKAIFLRSELFERLRSSSCLSIIEQSPVGRGPIALLSYHVQDPQRTLTKRVRHSTPEDWRNDLVVEGRHYSLLLTANHTSSGGFDADRQTRDVFDALTALVEQNGMTLLDNAIRSWLYVRDIDNHYHGMVRARREHFASHGLTDETRFLASTGILGMTHSPERILSLDALCVGGLSAGQVIRMEALSHLPPTMAYGVTFERGLRVRFGDRSHLYISGTASIDREGKVIHTGDVEWQTRRAAENVRALLEAQSASLDDMAYVIAYVRNAHDRGRVEKVLDEVFGRKTPRVLTVAAVCRPAWLMELEGVAIAPDRCNFPPFL